MSHLVRAREVFDIELAALRAVRGQLDESFNRAIDLMAAALSQRAKIIVTGIGKSGNIGRKIAATLTSTGATSVVLDGVDALHGDLGVISDQDVILALSYSGESEELTHLLPALRRFTVTIIAITGAPHSTLAKHSDLTLNARVPREACPFNLSPTASTTAMLALGDALAMALLQARGFKAQDFAKHHPSGAIGRALLLRVRDIMRSAKRNAVAEQSVCVKEALLIMTKARAGSVSVVNRNGKLVGVFTDGDLRRHLTEGNGILDQPLRQVMTREPIRIDQDALAAQALATFKEREIDDLIVINAKGEPVGMIDLQDLPKLKMV